MKVKNDRSLPVFVEDPSTPLCGLLKQELANYLYVIGLCQGFSNISSGSSQ